MHEKLGHAYTQRGNLEAAWQEYSKALQLPMTPLQRARVMLAQAQLLATFVKEDQAFDLYQQFLKEFPDYPDSLGIYQKMLPLARSLKKASEVEKIQKEVERLSPPAEK